MILSLSIKVFEFLSLSLSLSLLSSSLSLSLSLSSLSLSLSLLSLSLSLLGGGGVFLRFPGNCRTEAMGVKALFASYTVRTMGPLTLSERWGLLHCQNDGDRKAKGERQRFLLQPLPTSRRAGSRKKPC